jgi:hypothetical protein
VFRRNEEHRQAALFSSIYELPKKQLKRLKKSWAGVFYKEFFTRVEEELFGVLYSDEPSRPNIPVNVLMGLETLKSGFGCSDEELYDAFCYNMQVRYALGYRDLKEGHFELRTLYNFRRRITEYMQETGINLIEKAFEQVTDEQTEAFQLKTGKLRMDSTQIASPGQDLRQHSGDEPLAAAGGSAPAGAAHAERRGSKPLQEGLRALPAGDLRPICLPHQGARSGGPSAADR